jgi:hypothetical protein
MLRGTGVEAPAPPARSRTGPVLPAKDRSQSEPSRFPLCKLDALYIKRRPTQGSLELTGPRLKVFNKVEKLGAQHQR